jgi:diaminohydroxyphosphoribosylaminopyrimidine deaminase/5-amino-6-(5-phosphoribosylamino)uracil reductase
MTDLDYMKLALRFAERARGKTSPNPMVGAVVVKNGRIVAVGHHRKSGRAHAEAIALKSAGAKARGATLYVNLEPCCHTDKRTPPCTKAIIASGIRRVVAAMKDPNPKVAGRGVRELARAGIKVAMGLMKQEAGRLNEAYIKWITTGRPFVTMKVAASLDGKIASSRGESRWISGKKSRAYVHRLRNESDAVMVGIGTVLKDDPRLTARLAGKKGSDPVRVIVDSNLSIPLESKVLHLGSSAKTILATTKQASNAQIREVEKLGARVLIIESSNGRVDLAALMGELGRIGITNLLLEGGSELNASMLDTGLIDKIIFIVAPKIIGGRNTKGSFGGESDRPLSAALMLFDLEIGRLGEDILIRGYLRK